MNLAPHLLRTISLAVVASAISGCTLISSADEEREIIKKADAFKDVRPAAANSAPVSFAAARYFGSRVIRSSHGEQLPEAVAVLRVTIRRTAPISLEEFADSLSKFTDNLPIRVDGHLGGTPANGGIGQAAASPSSRSNPNAGLTPASAPGGGPKFRSRRSSIAISYRIFATCR